MPEGKKITDNSKKMTIFEEKMTKHDKMTKK